MAQLDDIALGAIPGDDPEKKMESLVKQLNEQSRVISNEDRTKIIKDDAGTQRLLTGYQQGGFNNGSVGAKLSQEGVDVLSATDDQLIWSTDFNSFKIVDTITADISISTGGAAAGGEVTVAHGQAYEPMVFGSMEITSGAGGVSTGVFPFPYFNIAASSPNPLINVSITIQSVSSTNVTFVWRAVAGITLVGTIKLFVLRETAA